MGEERRGVAGATVAGFLLVGAGTVLTQGLVGVTHASPAATAALVVFALAAELAAIGVAALAVTDGPATLARSPLQWRTRDPPPAAGGRGPDAQEPSTGSRDGDGPRLRRSAPSYSRSRGGSSGYRRDDGSDPLENEVRREINDFVARSPGTYPSRVARATDVSLSTVRYHLRVLREEGLVQEETFGGKRRLYPAGSDHLALAAALEDDATASIVRTLARSDPATVSDLAERLDRAPSTLSHHLSRLEDDDLVVRERDGVSVVTRLHPAVVAELDVAREEAADEPATGRA